MNHIDARQRHQNVREFPSLGQRGMTGKIAAPLFVERSVFGSATQKSMVWAAPGRQTQLRSSLSTAPKRRDFFGPWEGLHRCGRSVDSGTVMTGRRDAQGPRGVARKGCVSSRDATLRIRRAGSTSWVRSRRGERGREIREIPRRPLVDRDGV